MAAVVAWGRMVFVGPASVELGPGAPDLAVVELLARAALAARRGHGPPVQVRVCDELAALFDLVGLAAVVPRGSGGGMVR